MNTRICYTCYTCINLSITHLSLVVVNSIRHLLAILDPFLVILIFPLPFVVNSRFVSIGSSDFDFHGMTPEVLRARKERNEQTQDERHISISSLTMLWKSSEWRDFGAPDLYKEPIDPRGVQARSPGLDGDSQWNTYWSSVAISLGPEIAFTVLAACEIFLPTLILVSF